MFPFKWHVDGDVIKQQYPPWLQRKLCSRMYLMSTVRVTLKGVAPSRNTAGSCPVSVAA